ncbi:MAG TPA: SDR family NAD(P)-dependent oxidoreductase [Caulobacteraceae bacterium]|jgi:NAD(P)-dependent dehydrogenase (short-subunit alcohol dehydrogenase family)
MSGHSAIQPGRVAVITGAASGIGLAAAKRLAGFGMSLVLVDLDAGHIEAAAKEIVDSLGGSDELALVMKQVAGDVADAATLERAKAAAAEAGDVAILMNNAGVGGGGSAVENPDGWRRVIETNLFGVINGVQAFAQGMIDAGKPAAIVNTGSKQGITTPPGDTAYNVSKTGIKALTEGLQHTLRNLAGCEVTAHLLVPGFTFTGMTRRRVAEKPPGAWTAEQVVDFMLERMGAGDFYILCPDNDVTRQMDNARMTWAMQDLTQNRPPLSRWHPDYAHAFAEFLAKETGRG